VPSLTQVCVPVLVPLAQVQDVVDPAVQTAQRLQSQLTLATHCPSSEPLLWPTLQVPVRGHQPQTSMARQLLHSVVAAQGSPMQPQAPQAVPVLLQVSEPAPPPEQVQDCVAPAVQMIVGQFRQKPHDVPALEQVCVPVPPPEHEQERVEFGVQVAEEQSDESQSQLLPAQALFEEPEEVPVAQPLRPGHQPQAFRAVQAAQLVELLQASDEHAQVFQAEPSLAQVCVPVPPPAQEQPCVVFGVQTIGTMQSAQLPHAVPSGEQVCVPVPPPEQEQDWVSFGVQIIGSAQSTQLPHAVPSEEQVCVPVPASPQEQVCMALGVQTRPTQARSTQTWPLPH
jgi:hypothetical protein